LISHYPTGHLGGNQLIRMNKYLASAIGETIFGFILAASCNCYTSIRRSNLILPGSVHRAAQNLSLVLMTLTTRSILVTPRVVAVLRGTIGDICICSRHCELKVEGHGDEEGEYICFTMRLGEGVMWEGYGTGQDLLVLLLLFKLIRYDLVGRNETISCHCMHNAE